MLTFPGRHGTAIYLQNYLSTMFQISDVLVDKEEVAMCLNIRVPVPAHEEANESACVSNDTIIVSKPLLDLAAQKVLQMLDLQGIPCARCSKQIYKLFPCPSVGEGVIEADIESGIFKMEVLCSNYPVYSFELKMMPMPITFHKEGACANA